MSVISMPRMTPATVRVAEEVRALMGRYGVTQVQLQDVLNVKQSGVSKRLRGITPFDANEIGLLATFFNVPISVLFGETQPPDDGGPGKSTLVRSYLIPTAA